MLIRDCNNANKPIEYRVGKKKTISAINTSKIKLAGNQNMAILGLLGMDSIYQCALSMEYWL